jgi:hypothetical protein
MKSDLESDSKQSKKKKDKKDKKKMKKEKSKRDNDIIIPSFDDLFKATGGARLGMRARNKQTGKIARTEGDKVLTQDDTATKLECDEMIKKKSRRV